MVLTCMDESPRWLAMMGRNDQADAIVTKLETKAAAGGKAVPEVTDEEIAARAAEQEVKQLPFSVLFKKSMITRTLTAMFLCFVMNVLVYTIITWTPTILVAKGFDTSMSTLMTVVMQLGIPVGVGALTFYVEKVNRKTILIGSYLAVAILGPIWSLLPTDNTALIMGFGFLVCVFTFTNSVTTAAIYLSDGLPHSWRWSCKCVRPRCWYRKPNVDCILRSIPNWNDGRISYQLRTCSCYVYLAGSIRR